MESSKKLIKYILALVAGVLCILYVCYLKSFSFSMESALIYRILCDGCFFAAVMLLSLGLLVWISNFGLFLGLRYSVRRFMSVFGKNTKEKRKSLPSYYEYREAKLDHYVSSVFLLIPGIFYLAISFVFLRLCS